MICTVIPCPVLPLGRPHILGMVLVSTRRVPIFLCIDFLYLNFYSREFPEKFFPPLLYHDTEIITKEILKEIQMETFLYERIVITVPTLMSRISIICSSHPE